MRKSMLAIGICLFLLAFNSFPVATAQSAPDAAVQVPRLIKDLQLKYFNDGRVVTLSYVSEGFSVQVFRNIVRNVLKIPADKQVGIYVGYADLEDGKRLEDYDLQDGQLLLVESY